jgi:hypothetical protein
MNGASNNSGDWLLRALKHNPEGLLLLAAGAALFLRQGTTVPKTHRAPSPPTDSRPSPSVAERVQDATGPYVAEATDYARAASDTVRRQAEHVYDTTDRAFGRVVDQQPLVIALAGLAIGAAVAAAFPPTAIEQNAMGPIGARVNETAQRVASQAKDAAGAASDTLKAAAEERGFNAEGLKAVADDVATAFTDTMRGSGDDASKKTNVEQPHSPAS